MKLIVILIVGLAGGMRWFWHDISPPGFTADEAVFGYNAYSLLKYGADQFGTKFPVALRAFGDYRPALYSYLAVPFVKLFGLTEIATRLPSILAGTLTVLVIYLLTEEILKNLKIENSLKIGNWKLKISEIAAIFVAFSPSHILISRYADMSSLSTLFLGLGVWLWFRQPLLSSLSFVLAAYAYHNARLTGPLLILALILLYWSHFKSHLRQFFISAGGGIILLLPLITFLLRSPDLALRRGVYESWLSQKTYLPKLTTAITSDPAQQQPIITRFWHNKPKFIAQEFITRYTSHFDPNFLFLKGDTHERFQTPGSGVYNLSFSVLLPIGFVLGLRRREWRILPAWLLISPFVASIGLFTPNSLHSLDSVIPANILAAFGFFRLTHYLRLAVLLVFVYSIYRFWYGYLVTIPQTPQLRWNWFPRSGDYVDLVKSVPSDAPITVVGAHNFSQFYLFYNRIDPRQFQRQVKVNPVPDANGFEQIESLGNLKFTPAYNQDLGWMIFDRDSFRSSLTRCVRRTVADLYYLVYADANCLNSN